MTLKEMRTQKGLTQKEAAEVAEISLRSYVRYENEPEKAGTVKYKRILSRLQNCGLIDESHGVLTVEEIARKCRGVLEQYRVEYCYLFGSYAKGKATENSDVDLFIDTETTGIQFYGMVELLRETLGKKVDAIKAEKILQSPELLSEIMKYGVKIYG